MTDEAKLNTTAPAAATVTEAELFQRFLDAPMRIGPASTLLVQQEEGDFTAEQCVYQYHIAYCKSPCLEFRTAGKFARSTSGN